MARNEAPQGSTLPVTPPPSMCPSSASFEDGEKLDNLVHVKINDTTASSSTNGAARKHRNIDVDFNTLDIVFSLQSWVIILDFFGIGSPKANQAPAQYVELKFRWQFVCAHKYIPRSSFICGQSFEKIFQTYCFLKCMPYPRKLIFLRSQKF